MENEILQLLPLIGTIMLCSGVGLFFHRYFFLKNALTTNGEVIQLLYSRGGPGEGGVYFPLIKFSTSTGKIITFQSSVGKNPAAYSVGDKVPVLYQESAPKEARINSLCEIWWLPVTLTVAGILFIFPEWEVSTMAYHSSIMQKWS